MSVLDIIRRIAADRRRHRAEAKIPWRAGERVRVIAGAFVDFEGTVMNGQIRHGVLDVTVDISGKEVIAELAPEHIEKLTP